MNKEPNTINSKSIKTMFKVTCPKCGESVNIAYQNKDKFVGRKIFCWGCGRHLKITNVQNEQLHQELLNATLRLEMELKNLKGEF